MTIPVSDTFVIYTGNDLDTVFPFDFRVDDASTLYVSVITVATGAEVLIDPADYILTDVGDPAGGSVTYPIPVPPAPPPPVTPLSPAYQIKIARVVPLLQPLHFTQQGNFSPAILEGGLDYIVMMIQQLEAEFQVIVGGGSGITLNQKTVNIIVVIDGQANVITTGIKCDLPIPFDCVISEVTMLADQSGSIVIDVWKDLYANFPPTVADSICAAAKPTIAASNKSKDTLLVGWNKIINAGDTLRFNVDSVTNIKRVTLSMKITKV